MAQRKQTSKQLEQKKLSIKLFLGIGLFLLFIFSFLFIIYLTNHGGSEILTALMKS